MDSELVVVMTRAKQREWTARLSKFVHLYVTRDKCPFIQTTLLRLHGLTISIFSSWYLV